MHQRGLGKMQHDAGFSANAVPAVRESLACESGNGRCVTVTNSPPALLVAEIA